MRTIPLTRLKSSILRPCESTTKRWGKESPGDVESRCYLRDEGGEGDTLEERGELEKITLPKLFEYLEEITHVQGVGGPRVDPPHAGI